MMDPLNPAPGGAGAVPPVWPPPPTNSPFAAEPTPVSAVESFRLQNYWLVLLLTIITLGFYEVFWLIRQIAVIERLRPDLKLTPIYADVVLVALVLNLGMAIASGIVSSQTVDGDSNILSRIVGIMLLVLRFQVRNGLNMTLRARKDSPYWFSGVFTWLFGAAYQQYQINRNIQRWRDDPRRAAVPFPV